MRVLAADIVQYGTDPSTLPIVIPQPGDTGRYIVVEGNRRLAALRALENPESVATVVEPGILRQLRKLSKDYLVDPIESMTCVMFKDRYEANHWIELRHTGEAGGAGILRWGSYEAERFRARSGVAPPHIQALDFLQRHHDLSEETRKKLPVTTFKRLIEAPSLRQRIGVELQNRVLYLLASEDRVAKAMMHIVNDLASGNTKVGHVYSKKQRDKYASDLPPDIVVTPTIKSGYGVAASEAGTGSKPKPSGGGTRIPKKRIHLIPREWASNIPTGRIKNIEIELRKMTLEDHANAVSVLFRVFLELSVDAYLEKNIPAIDERTPLHKKMEATVNDLLKRKKLNRKQANPVRRALQKDSFLAPSVTLFHDYVHNQYVFPVGGDLRAHWDNLADFFAAMWAT